MENKSLILEDDGYAVGNHNYDDQLNFQLDTSYFRDFQHSKNHHGLLAELKYVAKDYILFTKTWLSRLMKWPVDQGYSKRYRQDKILKDCFIQGEIQEKLSTIRSRLLFANLDKVPMESPVMGRKHSSIKSAGMFPLSEAVLQWVQQQSNLKNLIKKYPNLKRNSQVTTPEQLWIADITFTNTREGKRYFHMITDAYTNQVMGYAVSEDLTTASAIRALKMALGNRKHYGDLIHHSKRGIHYCMHRYIQLLRESNIKMSASEF